MARIAILIPDLRGGGAERVALSLVNGFLEQGHDVDLLVLKRSGQLADQVPSTARLVELGADRFRHSIAPLVRYLRLARPDALLAIMWPLTVIAVAARLLARVPVRVVISEHAILSDHYRDRRWALAMLRLTGRALYPLADARVTASAGIADDLARLSRLPPNLFRPIANPIAMPPEVIDTAAADALWPTGGYRILTVGMLKPDKDHCLLLDAFARLARKREACLMIVGEGSLQAKLQAHAEKLGISDRVALPGFRSDLWPIYAGADLFVLSSATEGFGNVLVEAMAVGVPVVSTDCAGPREVLADGRFGTLVRHGDPDALSSAMEEALDAPADGEMLKTRARQFSPELATDRYLELLLKSQNER